MPLYHRTGDIFTSTAQVLVNPVNCAGVMGKGLALQFKERYPDMFSVYRQQCQQHIVVPGYPVLYRFSTPWILNFPTKWHYYNPSRLSYIEEGLRTCVTRFTSWHIHSIAFPRLGCGAGGLSWQKVRPVMERYLSQLEIDVYIYE